MTINTKMKKNIDPGFCGTYTGYRAGCRCENCMQARYDYRKAYREDGTFGTGEHKLPIGPLMNFFGNKDCDRDAVAQVLKVHRDTVRSWLANPTKVIDKFTADTYAMRAGLHPSAIWGNDWFRIPFFLNKTEQEELMGEASEFAE